MYFFCFQNERLPSLLFDTLVNHWTTMLIQNKFLYMTTSSNKWMELILFFMMFQIISLNFSVWFLKTSQFDFVILTINTHMFHQQVLISFASTSFLFSQRSQGIPFRTISFNPRTCGDHENIFLLVLNHIIFQNAVKCCLVITYEQSIIVDLIAFTSSCLHVWTGFCWA